MVRGALRSIAARSIELGGDPERLRRLPADTSPLPRRAKSLDMNTTASPREDPWSIEPQPPFKGQEQIDPPGKTSEMSPRPDHGEKSYRGNGLLQDFATV